MSTEIKIKDRTAQVELISRKNNLITIKVDNHVYDLDLIKVGPGIYSALLNGKSYNIEMIAGNNGRNYTVNTFYNSYEVEIIDPQTRYRNNRKKSSTDNGTNTIVSPMPGKVVRILVQEGDQVEAGQTVLVISAMKMESEFKAAASGKVHKIYAKEGDIVDGNKVLMIIE